MAFISSIVVLSAQWLLSAEIVVEKIKSKELSAKTVAFLSCRRRLTKVLGKPSEVIE